MTKTHVIVLLKRLHVNIFFQKKIFLLYTFLVFNQDTSKVFQQRAETADENQRILLLVPEFLPRVCSLASESIGIRSAYFIFFILMIF